MTPEFIVELRRHVGHAELWLLGVTVVVVRGPVGAEEVLLVRRADDGRWTPVTGIVDPGEEPDTAGVREVAEETALEVAMDTLLSVQVTRTVEYANGDRARYLDHAFLASIAVAETEGMGGAGVVGGAGNDAEAAGGVGGAGSTGGVPHPADGENTAAEWVPLADLPAMGSRFDRTVELAITTRRGESAGGVLFGTEERRR